MRRTLPVAVPKGTSTQRVELGPIDPSSLVSLDQGVIINRALFDAAEDENAVLRRLVGRKLTVERGKQGGGTETFQVTLLGVDPSRFLMPDGSVAFGNPGGALRYPADAVSTTQAATLTLTSASGRKDLPLGWFTDGAQWMRELRRDPRREGCAGRGQCGDQLADVQRHRRRGPAARRQRVARGAGPGRV